MQIIHNKAKKHDPKLMKYLSNRLYNHKIQSKPLSLDII